MSIVPSDRRKNTTANQVTPLFLLPKAGKQNRSLPSLSRPYPRLTTEGTFSPTLYRQQYRHMSPSSRDPSGGSERRFDPCSLQITGFTRSRKRAISRAVKTKRGCGRQALLTSKQRVDYRSGYFSWRMLTTAAASASGGIPPVPPARASQRDSGSSLVSVLPQGLHKPLKSSRYDRQV